MGILKKLFGTRYPAPNHFIHPDDKELVTDSDFKWWQSITLEDCKAFEHQDNIARLALFMKLVEKDGFSKEDASKRVRKVFTFYYGTPEQRDNEPLGFSGDDSKLPYILRDRANKAIMKYMRNIEEEIESSTSINAIIRSLIRAGKV